MPAALYLSAESSLKWPVINALIVIRYAKMPSWQRVALMKTRAVGSADVVSATVSLTLSASLSALRIFCFPPTKCFDAKCARSKK